MQILEMMLPRLEALSRIAGDRDTTRDAVLLAELREDYRYMAAVCRNVLPDLEPELAELPEPFPPGSPVEVRVAYQMALVRRTNRLYRAVNAVVDARLAARAAREAQRRQG